MSTSAGLAVGAVLGGTAAVFVEVAVGVWTQHGRSVAWA
ncbi:putative membrane protein [Mycobacterium kansasii 662]|uniref:Putative membrane protein n=1 Tax=Mycobacterium kansasii 662 TaxID=1299326 RepID=X7ZCZ4_MYCKA|nr:putative membrane protein [Mycobacterium kansasii 824]EUA16861.1 putative membrane protein [Mycobacterium kansasii 662]KEP41865.1 hypothetical protein MKSMC1_30200 [Mycobacterium kansasii]